jgi:uncharacterized protein (DUF2235 family)
MTRIVLLSDGTGNAAASVWKTNVWRTFEGIDLSASDQIAYYDDGVGTSSFKPLAILGGVFGYGLKRNVLDIYKFLCRNYKSQAEYAAEGQTCEGDEIFAFGFSRGAFTIRTLLGFVADQGLVKYTSEAALEKNAGAAYRQYRNKHFRTKTRIEVPIRWLRSFFVSATHDVSQKQVDEIKFVGVWDTVAAYGLPIDEMARGVSRYLFPLELPGRTLNAKIKRACHALSLDDERTTFHPVLWNEEAEKKQDGDRWKTTDETITQVWFAGVHSNVGGGYPDDSLACVPLTWILEEAAAKGLRLKQRPTQEPDTLTLSQSAKDKDGRLYDSRSGLGGYYRYGPRSVEELSNSRSDDPRDKVRIDLPKIHHSVLDRVRMNAHLYAPVGLPQNYAVVNENREVVRQRGETYEAIDQAQQRRSDQEKIWNTVWRRRIIYFLSVCASLYLAMYPLFWIVKPDSEASTRLRFISDFIELVGTFLPSFSSRWLRAYASDPVWFLEWAIIVGLFLYWGSVLKAHITDRMRVVWDTSLCGVLSRPITSITEGSRRSLALWSLLLVASLYLLLVPDARHVELFRKLVTTNIDSNLIWIGWPTLPSLPETAIKDWLAAHVTVSIPILFALAAAAFLIPDRVIQKVRLTPRYQNALWSLKMRLAPIFFAGVFFLFGVAFFGHFLFNVSDGAGWVCKSSPDAKEVLSHQEKYFDIGSNREVDKTTKLPKILGPDEFCFATGWKLERGQRYAYSIETAPGPGDLEISTNLPRWAFWNSFSSIAGVSMAGVRQTHPLHEKSAPTTDGLWWDHLGVWAKSQLRTNDYDDSGQLNQELKDLGYPGWKRILAWVLYPLRRSLDRPWGSVIVRYGVEGNEESFLDPDVAMPNEHQSESKIVSRDGELFIYVNKPVATFWWLDRWISSTLIPSKGIAKVTIEPR